MRCLRNRLALTANAIKQSWAQNSLEASRRGTYMHLTIEAFLNGAHMRSMTPELDMFLKFIRTLDGHRLSFALLESTRRDCLAECPSRVCLFVCTPNVGGVEFHTLHANAIEV